MTPYKTITSSAILLALLSAQAGLARSIHARTGLDLADLNCEKKVNTLIGEIAKTPQAAACKADAETFESAFMTCMQDNKGDVLKRGLVCLCSTTAERTALTTCVEKIDPGENGVIKKCKKITSEIEENLRIFLPDCKSKGRKEDKEKPDVVKDVIATNIVTATAPPAVVSDIADPVFESCTTCEGGNEAAGTTAVGPAATTAASSPADSDCNTCEAEGGDEPAATSAAPDTDCSTCKPDAVAVTASSSVPPPAQVSPTLAPVVEETPDVREDVITHIVDPQGKTKACRVKTKTAADGVVAVVTEEIPSTTRGDAPLTTVSSSADGVVAPDSNGAVVAAVESDIGTPTAEITTVSTPCVSATSIVDGTAHCACTDSAGVAANAVQATGSGNSTGTGTKVAASTNGIGSLFSGIVPSASPVGFSMMLAVIAMASGGVFLL